MTLTGYTPPKRRFDLRGISRAAAIHAGYWTVVIMRIRHTMAGTQHLPYALELAARNREVWRNVARHPLLLLLPDALLNRVAARPLGGAPYLTRVPWWWIEGPS